MPKSTINKTQFKQVYQPELEVIGKELVNELAPFLEVSTYSKIIEKLHISIDKETITFSPFTLETPWENAPYEDDFKSYSGRQVTVNNIVFKLQTDERFLKTRSSVSFSFVASKQQVSK